MAPALPPKDTPSNLRRNAQRQRRDGPSEWRNSLIAVDDSTGTVMGVLARGVMLPRDEMTSSSDEEGEEAVTPTMQLEYSAAHVYNDADYRAPSRNPSILREDTFAPPPIPPKPDCPRQDKFVARSYNHDAEGVDVLEGTIINGQIGVSALHAEAHRPDLLRDTCKAAVEEECDSDASGSTEGGPAVQLWRKARGGKGAKAKKKAKKEAKAVQKLKLKETPAATKAEEEDKIHNGAIQKADANELAAKGPGYWLNATKKSVMSRHLPGHSVLIDFLSGSRIVASVIKNTSQSIPKQHSSDTTVFTPTLIASIPQTGMMAYIPVLPSHLLWFFGMGATTPETVRSSEQDDRGLAVMGEDLLAIVQSMSPSSLVGLASSSATAALTSVSNWGIAATSWFDAGLSLLPWAAAPDSTPNLDQAERGDDDAEEWEWAIPDFDTSSYEDTPRPVYRRKKLNPSMQGNYTADRSNQSRYSILHFDEHGIPRRAITRNLAF
jgi:hypothetical protein